MRGKFAARLAITVGVLTVLLLILLGINPPLFSAAKSEVWHFGVRFMSKHFHLAILVPMYVGLFAVEACLVGWRNSSLYQVCVVHDRSSRLDLAMFVFGGLPVMAYVKVVTTAGLAIITSDWLTERAHAAGMVVHGIGGLPLLLQVVILYLVHTFIGYWNHRLVHGRQLWPLHRFHHSATEFCIFTTEREHPSEISAALMFSLPLFLLSPSKDAALVATIGVAFLQHVIHSRLPGDFGILGRWVIQTPMQHRLHHSAEASPETVCNFSLCPLWDRMFGTWRPISNADFTIGVSDRDYHQGAWFIPDLWRDYRDFVVGMVEVFWGVCGKRSAEMRRRAQSRAESIPQVG